ncbi:uncharacterized protein LOC107047999 [Diachasma alloeum]|uniref:uncharacterized protein LOC107047999 n=1 Tax=Diachasma alloeum TaxID=454923 RepID=UPI00073825D8|nr:uncharacterized protein LOC107047999 [Diachasma alloeum]
MTSIEALHEKFLTTSIIGLRVLEVYDPSFEKDPLDFIHRNFDLYHKKVHENTATGEQHEAFRTLLCYQYQLQAKSNFQCRSRHSHHNLLNNVIKNLLCPEDNDENMRTILDDVAILQIILYLNLDQIGKLFRETLKFTSDQIHKGNALQDCLPVVETLVDGLSLRKKIEGDSEKDVLTLLSREMKLWFRVIDENNSGDWTPFLSILLKVTTTFPEVFLNFSWDLVAGCRPGHEERRALTLLCSIIDDLFSKSSQGSFPSAVSKNLSFCFNSRVLSLICSHLTSPVQLYRKQSQYVLRRITDYSREHLQQIFPERKGNPLKPPFVFSNSPELDVEKIKNNYFFLLETLEGKQAQLILPQLNLLDNLLDASISEGVIDILWVRCIFTRILTHDNITISKAGLIMVLRMELEVFDDGFISLLTQSLNHTFLYESQNFFSRPRIAEELSKLFVKAEISRTNLIRKVILAAAQVPWQPIPLFYVLEALGRDNREIQVEHNVWTSKELEALKTIAERYLKNQSGMMQIATKTNILSCITIYVRPPLDLRDLGQFFLMIGDEGFLKRDNNNWRRITSFLRDHVEEATALEFVSASCESLKSDEDIKSLGLLIVLLYDSGSPFFRACVSSDPLAKILSPLNAHRDENPSGLLVSLKMISCLMELSPRLSDSYVQLIFGSSKNILNLIWSGPTSRAPGSFDEGLVYVSALKAMITLRDLSNDFTESLNRMMKLEREEVKRIDELINSNKTPLLQAWYSLNILFLSNNERIECSRRVLDDDERIVSAFHILIAKIHYRRIRTADNLPEAFYRKLFSERLMILAETQSPESIPLMASILSLIFIRLKDSVNVIMDCVETIQEAIETSWRSLWSMQRSPEFWGSARELIRLVWSENLFKIPKLRRIVLTYAEEIISRTDNTSPLRYLLFHQINLVSGQYILFFRQVILTSILQTDGGKNRKVEVQTLKYIKQMYMIDVFEKSLMTGLGAYTDKMTRALLVTMILKLGTRTEGKDPKELLSSYVPQLISTLEKHKNASSEDSDAHRLRMRVMQVLLLLNVDDEHAKKVHDALRELLLAEKNPMSVRIMQEWVLVRLYVDNEDMTALIWDLFPVFREKQPESLMSLMSIVHHVAKGLYSNERLVYLKKAVENILPSSCFAQNRELQLHSQVVLLKLFELIGEIDPTELREYDSFRKAVHDNLESERVKVKTEEMMENFYLPRFDATGDLNLQTIFYDVLRLSNEDMGEWIEPEVFAELLPGYLNYQWFRYWYEGGQLIGREPPVMKRIELPDIILQDVSQEEVIVGIEGGITPAASGGILPIILRPQLTSNDTGLIVIASLIEDFCNLDGLTRAAEIFCARELVLEAKRHTEDKDLKGITISEVKPQELREYLLQKKSRGWKLVGAEKTVNSVNLLNMKFNKKTILILGNENTGIPANLIQLMDTCVEIPQAEVPRSLNVQGTGTICLWQYAQQHLLHSS